MDFLPNKFKIDCGGLLKVERNNNTVTVTFAGHTESRNYGIGHSNNKIGIRNGKDYILIALSPKHVDIQIDFSTIEAFISINWEDNLVCYTRYVTVYTDKPFIIRHDISNIEMLKRDFNKIGKNTYELISTDKSGYYMKKYFNEERTKIRCTYIAEDRDFDINNSIKLLLAVIDDYDKRFDKLQQEIHQLKTYIALQQTNLSEDLITSISEF